MKNQTRFLTISLMLISLASFAQRPDFSAKCKEEMTKLSYLVGDWQGEAIVNERGTQRKISQTEHIVWEMDGLVLSIKGTGREGDAVSFQAFAIVNFDPADQQFKLKSYVKEGFSTNAYFKIMEANKFEWGFDIPAGGKSKYTITLDPEKKTWYEVGEYSRDGSQWFPFIQMNLVKQ
ncbi:MAG: hypothetical protein ACOYXA_13725 [Bacteroidota bacterium]